MVATYIFNLLMSAEGVLCMELRIKYAMYQKHIDAETSTIKPNIKKRQCLLMTIDKTIKISGFFSEMHVSVR